jgi:hypothetical protein
MATSDLDQRPTSELIGIALDEQSRHAEADEGDRENVGALLALQRRTTREVFDAAVSLLGDDDPDRRILGARILREHGGSFGGQTYAADAGAALRRRLSQEIDANVLGYLIPALSQHSDPVDFGMLLRFSEHDNSDVREAAASRLLHGVDYVGDERIVGALARLTEDSSDGVRYSAVYDIASWLDIDCDVRLVNALLARIDDKDAVVRAVARAGCARSRAAWRRLLQAEPDLVTTELMLVDNDGARPQVRLRVPARHPNGGPHGAVVAWGDHWGYSELIYLDLEKLRNFATECDLIVKGGANPAHYSDSSLSFTVDRHEQGVPQITVVLGDDRYWAEALSIRHQLGEDGLVRVVEHSRKLIGYWSRVN